MCNTEQVIWRLSYDKDCGLRGNRRNVFWYRFWKLSPEETKTYIAKELNKDICDIEMNAVSWKKICVDKPYKIVLGGD